MGQGTTEWSSEGSRWALKWDPLPHFRTPWLSTALRSKAELLTHLPELAPPTCSQHLPGPLPRSPNSSHTVICKGIFLCRCPSHRLFCSGCHPAQAFGVVGAFPVSDLSLSITSQRGRPTARSVGSS